jgi:hypothetical protein
MSRTLTPQIRINVLPTKPQLCLAPRELSVTIYEKGNKTTQRRVLTRQEVIDIKLENTLQK